MIDHSRSLFVVELKESGDTPIRGVVVHGCEFEVLNEACKVYEEDSRLHVSRVVAHLLPECFANTIPVLVTLLVGTFILALRAVRVAKLDDLGSHSLSLPKPFGESCLKCT